MCSFGKGETETPSRDQNNLLPLSVSYVPLEHYPPSYTRPAEGHVSPESKWVARKSSGGRALNLYSCCHAKAYS